ncbi:hypothetical protein BDW62DRAFT_62612 [Aspergillus aurantiobrunneus]
MTTPPMFRLLLVHLWITSSFLAFAFDPLGVVYEVAGNRFSRRAGTLGGNTAAIIETGDSERPYTVDGNTFTDYNSAAQRSCNIQFDNCQKIANEDSSASFSVDDCQSQQNDCLIDPPAAEDDSSSMTAATVETSDTGDSNPTDPGTDADTTGSDAVASNTSESATSAVESVAAEPADTTESSTADPDTTEPDTTKTDPVLVAQTTIPYDSEFDIVCDL